jgi:predicted negative regulator of RcsB-dependent stress response
VNNELSTEKSWWKRNWKWLLPLFAIILFFILIINSNLNSLGDLAQSYSDPSLYQNAINQANKNDEVTARFGKIDPVDKVAVLEGSSTYSNNNSTVNITFRVSGKTQNGKMDLTAVKNGKNWEYKKIIIRLKKNTEVIKVIE